MVSYCKNCGEKLNEGTQFCNGCGKQLKKLQHSSSRSMSEERSVNQSYGQNETADPVIPKAKINFINVKTVSALITILLLAGTYFFVGRMFTPEAVSEGFIDAVIEKDVQKVKAYINEGQIEVKATDDQTEEFIQYLNSNPKILSELTSNLKTESLELNESDEPTTVNTQFSNIVNLKWNGKKMVFFNHYIIEVKPYYATVTTSYANTKIQINNETVSTVKENEEETIGPFLPGEHQIKAVINGEFGAVEKTIEIDGSNMEDRTVYINFDWSDMYLSFYTDNDDATLFINGKSTGKKLEDFDQFGPLSFDGSLKLHAEKQFGSDTKKTETVVVDEGASEIDFLFNYEGEENYADEEVSAEVPEMDSSDDKSLIEETIYYHYGSITNDDFQQAYDIFSSERKSSVTVEQWSKGLQANRSDEVGIINVTEIKETTAIAYVEMTSYDENEDGSTLVQEWGGNWHLVKEDGRWVLDKAKLQKLSSRTE